jgi:predicted peroxiredoxin
MVSFIIVDKLTRSVVLSFLIRTIVITVRGDHCLRNDRTARQQRKRHESEAAMAGKAVISLTTGLEDPEKVTVAFLVAVGAAESGRPTLMFQAKEAVRLAMDGVATGVACDGCPALPDLLARYEKAGGRFMVCPVCFNAKQLDKGDLLPNAELAGSVQLWDWIGDGATTFSY